MLRISQLKLPVEHTDKDLKDKVRKLLRTKENPDIVIVRRSVDARKKPELFFNYILDIHIKNEKEIYKHCDKKQVLLQEEKEYRFPVKGCVTEERPVIIGMGPAGLFCAYMLAEAGFRPIVLERGCEVEQRTADVEAFWKAGKLNPQSNVQFGEGGAGTFSDGKLNTLVKDKYGRNRKVLSIFVKEGAPEEILYDYKPHIGTDILKTVITNMRKQIIAWGGDIYFRSQVTGFDVEQGKLKAVIVNNRKRIETGRAVLALGHSARDTFQTLYDMGVQMEAKPFAVGFRVEHPQQWINRAQYGCDKVECLGSAPYKVTASVGKRGVYSFCMCPGGYVVNASSEEGRLAVNGMSYHARDSRNANSAIIVSVTPEDFADSHPLAGIAFQRMLEEKAYHIGNGKIPVERYQDFKDAVLFSEEEELREKAGENSGEKDLEVMPCIKGQWCMAPVHEILPEELNRAFVEGMEQFGKVMKGFADDNVLIEGIESRTSSPVRIVRDDSLQSVIGGIYPCGEGAGYAGGITSAAMDGMKVAEELAKQMTSKQGVRSWYLQKRNSMDISERKEKSTRIAESLQKESCYQEADAVFVYMDYRSEVITTPLVQKLLMEGKQVFAPKVKGSELSFYEISSMEDLESGYQGIREPAPKQEMLFKENILNEKKCLVLVPGVAFDRNLHRMGYGKGFYDRFLEQCGDRALIAGLAFACQLAKQLPTECHDRSMDLIITEKEVIRL